MIEASQLNCGGYLHIRCHRQLVFRRILPVRNVILNLLQSIFDVVAIHGVGVRVVVLPDLRNSVLSPRASELGDKAEIFRIELVSMR